MTASPGTLSVERALPGRVPDFFIVGHAKCGTTALYEALRRHPQIYMPDFKEPMFFARNPSPPALAPGVKSFEQTGRRRETLKDYLSLFGAASPAQRVGEASTFYLWSPSAPARIAEMQPRARIIALLREPASFLHSLHQQMLQNHAESEKDLRRAIALEGARREGREIPPNSFWPQALMYSDRVRYADQLRRYHAVFPREQVLVLIYEDFRRDNDAIVGEVLRFLGVDDSTAPQITEANPTVSVRSVRVNGLIRELRQGRGPSRRAARTAIKTVTTHGMRTSVLYPLRRRLSYGAARPPDPSLMMELRRRFKGEVEAASEYLGRDLVSLWGYDRV